MLASEKIDGDVDVRLSHVCQESASGNNSLKREWKRSVEQAFIVKGDAVHRLED